MTQYTRTTLAVAVLLAAAAAAPAEEAQKPLGTWVRHIEGHKVNFDVKPDTVRCTITEGGYAISVDADYIVSKDGVLLGIIRTRGADKKAEENELDKRLFYCRFAVEKNALVISDLNVGGDKDKVKELVEGRYKKLAEKHPSPVSASSYKPKAPKTGANAYAGNPEDRIKELLIQSDFSGPIGYGPVPTTPTDKPSGMPPVRVHGGIQ
jgi:hypothetical protein